MARHWWRDFGGLRAARGSQCLGDMTSHALRLGLASLTLLTAFTFAPDASAEDVVRPSTRPAWAAFGLGPSIATLACGGGGCASGSFTQFKLTQEIGYHVNGSGDGFAIGAAVSEAFGNGLFRFQPGLRMWGDIPVSDDLGLYITPFGHVGYTLLTGGGATAHAFNPAVGVAARLVLADRAIISFSPVTFDFLVDDDGMIMSYELAFAGGVTF